MTDDLAVRRRRLAICTACEYWYVGQCRKGHPGPQSNLGCPVGRFTPLNGAMYANDPRVAVKPPPKPCCGRSS